MILKIDLLPRGKKAWIRTAAGLLLLLILVVGGPLYMLAMPGKSHQGPLPPLSDDERAMRDRLRECVQTLAGEIGERNVVRSQALERAARHIEQAFQELGYEPVPQEFQVGDQTVRNIEVEIPGGSRAGEIVVVGAHYDSVIVAPGANDNASAVAALLELARMLRDAAPARTVRLVAFVNEEPPHFQTGDMGSLRYARRCRQRGEKIAAMLALETIGYYSDEPGSQHYPPLVSAFYPSTGNFIAFVGNLRSRALVRRCVGSFRRRAAFPSEGAALPGWVSGVGWSDHWAFWQQGYRALMVTDTAPFRYPYYHTAQDTPDKVDFERLARVVTGLAAVVRDLAAINPGTPIRGHHT